ncbi:MAG TPA: DUF697 domain-containing protein [Syntrophales bacterium]|nr:DUF697 domain-containing protein [Syntrophales bacterium]HPI57987.1 DUF697 domain-containing protein [Syntrophales bacterium]HPN25885.1 DUF697 domain-containing protein [Syntrophales bacterium]HQM29559.1 DUF697 domain-containing protein [Syntrophales bacterium]
MKETFRKIAFLASAFVLFFFVLFVINQTAQVVDLASRVSPLAGTVVLWLLVGLYAAVLVVTAVMFLRLPKPLIPPESEEAPEFPAYLKALRERLTVNPLLKGEDLSGREQVERALAVLSRGCDDIIQKSAATVFVSTAISQSGRLDALFVLTTQWRMVWQIAKVYYQRPTFRDLAYLYSNVAATVFMASELDDIDVSEQVQPVISSTLGAVSLSIPGMQALTSILVNSVLTGAANAFLTLRVGIIAKRYCGSLVMTERKSIRRSAAIEAAKLLGSIVRQGTGRVSKALWEASKDKAGGAVSGVAGFARGVKDSLFSKLGVTKIPE